jgi:hypothetical protein
MNPLRTYGLEPTAKLDDRQKTAGRLADYHILLPLILFCIVGLLITANLVLRFPEPGPSVEQFNALVGP